MCSAPTLPKTFVQLEVVIIVSSAVVIIQCLGASCGHVFPLCSLLPASLTPRGICYYEYYVVVSVFVRCGNIFIMMPTGPKVLRSVRTMLYMLTICMPEMINVSTPANLLTSVQARFPYSFILLNSIAVCFTLAQRFSLHLFIVI